MTSLSKFTIILGAIAASAVSSQAAVTNFIDHNLGGITATWDIFAGANRIPSWMFSTVDSGNSIEGYHSDLNLSATVPGYVAGSSMTQATGPIDSDGSTPGGDRQLFYTFFGAVSWNVSATAEEATDTVILLIQNVQGSAGSTSNVTLNGVTATGTTDANRVTTYRWDNLSISSGDAINLTWATNTPHSVFDAFQLQTGTIPEPSGMVLAGVSLLGLAARRSRKDA